MSWGHIEWGYTNVLCKSPCMLSEREECQWHFRIICSRKIYAYRGNVLLNPRGTDSCNSGGCGRRESCNSGKMNMLVMLLTLTSMGIIFGFILALELAALQCFLFGIGQCGLSVLLGCKGVVRLPLLHSRNLLCSLCSRRFARLLVLITVPPVD